MLCTRVCTVALEFVKRQPVLENAPLAVVICQLRYPRQLGISEADVRPLQREIGKDYPVPRVGRTTELTVTPAGVAPSGEPEPVYQFLSDDAAWTVTVGPDAMSLETTAYVDFVDFLTRWQKCAEAVKAAFDLERQDRIGLRYVNELACAEEHPTVEDLRALVRDELVGVVGAHARTTRLLTSMHEMRFGQDRGTCTLRHGLVRAPSHPPTYVIDADFYDETSAALDLEDQFRLLADFNHGAFELFRWAVSPELFSTFNPTEPPTNA